MTVGIGVEIGSSGLRAAVLEREGARLTLRAAHEVGCDTANPETLSRAFAELRQILRNTGPVVLGVPSTSAILATVSPLVAVPQRAVLAVQFELQQILPFDLADAAWHYRWVSRNGQAAKPGSGFGVQGSGSRALAQNPQPRTPSPQQFSSAIVAAMRRSLLEERLACCRQAGLAVKAVAVSPIAALNAWDAQRAASGPARGTGGTTMLLLHDERSAEWVVRTASSVQVISVTSDSAERLGEELAASWESLRAQPEGAPVPVWVSGTSELVARVQAQAGAAGPLFEPVALSQIVDTGSARAPAAGRALAAVGLALQALDAVPVALNLLEGVQRETQERLAGRTAAALSVVLLLAAFGFGLSGMVESRARRAQLLLSLERREHLYQALRPEIRTRLRRQQRIEQYSAQLERLTADASLVTRLLGQLAATLPESVWLTSLECSKNGLLSGMLEGRATSFQDVTRFFDRLKSVAGMTTVKPVSTSVKTDETTGKEVIAFSVQVQRPLAPPEQPELVEGSGLGVEGKTHKPRTPNPEPRTN